MSTWYSQLNDLDPSGLRKLPGLKSRARLIEVSGEDVLGGMGMPRHPKHYMANVKPLAPEGRKSEYSDKE